MWRMAYSLNDTDLREALTMCHKPSAICSSVFG